MMILLLYIHIDVNYQEYIDKLWKRLSYKINF